MTGKLAFQVETTCKVTRARCGLLTLHPTSNAGRRTVVRTPVFMPVGTNGTLKGLLPEQIEGSGCNMMLSNTYHLASRPGSDIVEQAGGLHNFMRWRNGLLTDSGGFQMVSLSKLMELDEEKVAFKSPYNPDELTTLTPEDATRVQHQIGANIIMQLDDVISSTHQDEARFEEATHRTIRWYDRCRGAHEKSEERQNLFPIVQGGLNSELRSYCAKELIKRDPPGIAIGGLSGGECKKQFIEMVSISTLNLPAHKPRYLMGVGYAVDMILCVALGVDMFDCVYPTRTARFGYALVGLGSKLHLNGSEFSEDFQPIDVECDCETCKGGYNRAFIHHLVKRRNAVACSLVTQHNVRFQMRFMQKIRESIKSNKFHQLILETLNHHYSNRDNYPDWALKALEILQI